MHCIYTCLYIFQIEKTDNKFLKKNNNKITNFKNDMIRVEEDYDRKVLFFTLKNSTSLIQHKHITSKCYFFPIGSSYSTSLSKVVID